LILAQIVGFVALFFCVAQYQHPKRGGILSLQIIALLLWSAHYFLMSALTAAVLAVVAAIRLMVFYHRDEKKWAQTKFWPGLFILLFVVFGIVSWQAWYSVFPIVGFIGGTIAYWMISPKHIRLLTLLVQIPWIIYAVIIGSYPAFLNETFVIVSVSIGIYRFDF